MTREEAINIMKVIVHMLEEKYDTDRVEDAVDMAIKALEQEQCDCDGCEKDGSMWGQESCDDCIKIPRGATNGDVINSVFPDLAEYLFLNVYEEEWWDSPYGKEQE